MICPPHHQCRHFHFSLMCFAAAAASSSAVAAAVDWSSPLLVAGFIAIASGSGGIFYNDLRVGKSLPNSPFTIHLQPGLLLLVKVTMDSVIFRRTRLAFRRKPLVVEVTLYLPANSTVPDVTTRKTTHNLTRIIYLRKHHLSPSAMFMMCVHMYHERKE